jgi:hypothetical protein
MTPMAFPYEPTHETILARRVIEDIDELDLAEGGAARIDTNQTFEPDARVELVITDEDGLDVRLLLALEQAERLRDALAGHIKAGQEFLADVDDVDA